MGRNPCPTLTVNRQPRWDINRARRGRHYWRWSRKDHRAPFSSVTNQSGTLFQASARASWVACRICKPAAGGERAWSPPPGSLLPYCFSGRHLLELMVDFATDRTKKLVEFVFDWRPVGRALVLELVNPHLRVRDLLLELPNQRKNFFLLLGSESIRRPLHSFQLRFPCRYLC